MKKQLPVQWTKHLQGEKRDNLEALVRNSTIVLSRLYEILEEELAQIEAKEYSITDFEDPSWSQKQAFRNGSKAQINKLKNLLSFLK